MVYSTYLGPGGGAATVGGPQVGIALEFARKHQIEFIVAVGGGSSMDCAKGVNFLLTNGGHMIDYKGFGKASKPMLPSVAVPTTAGTGSEVSASGVLPIKTTTSRSAP